MFDGPRRAGDSWLSSLPLHDIDDEWGGGRIPRQTQKIIAFPSGAVVWGCRSSRGGHPGGRSFGSVIGMDPGGLGRAMRGAARGTRQGGAPAIGVRGAGARLGAWRGGRGGRGMWGRGMEARHDATARSGPGVRTGVGRPSGRLSRFAQEWRSASRRTVPRSGSPVRRRRRTRTPAHQARRPEAKRTNCRWRRR